MGWLRFEQRLSPKSSTRFTTTLAPSSRSVRFLLYHMLRPLTLITLPPLRTSPSEKAIIKLPSFGSAEELQSRARTERGVVVVGEGVLL